MVTAPKLAASKSLIPAIPGALLTVEEAAAFAPRARLLNLPAHPATYPRFENQRLCDFNREEIQRFILKKLYKGYAWEMGKRIVGLLSKVFFTAIEWGYLYENPACGIKMPERTLKRPHTSLSVEEIRKLFIALEGPERSFVLLAVFTGLRLGELLALRWGRVDFGNSILRVEGSCFMGRFGTPKTRSSRRTVALAPFPV